MNNISNYKKIKNKYKNIFIFILFLFLCWKINISKAEYYQTNNNPCNPEDSWVLYENRYENTLIVTDPYAE